MTPKVDYLIENQWVKIYFGLGGGGDSFGVVVAWKVRLVTVPSTVTLFTVIRTMEQNATKIINKYQFIANKLHEDIYLDFVLFRSNSTMVAAFTSLFLGGIDRLLPLMQ